MAERHSAPSATALVFVIVLVTKFAHGAWIVVVAAPILFVGDEGGLAPLRADRRRSWRPRPPGVTLPARVHSVVLVSNLLAPTLRALAFAEATSPATLRAVKVAAEEADDPLPREWEERGVPVPLVVIESPYRETVRPVLRYVRQLRREHPGDVISIVIPEYVVAHWWEHLLHNQTALRLKGRLLFEPSVAVTSVPWVLGAREDDLAVMNDPVTYIRSEDLLDESAPKRLARGFGLTRRRQLTGLALARAAAAAGDPAAGRARRRARPRRPGAGLPARGGRDRDRRRRAGRDRLGDRLGAADQLLLRRARAHAHGRRPGPGRHAGRCSSSSRCWSAARSSSRCAARRRPSAPAPRPRRCRRSPAPTSRARSRCARSSAGRARPSGWSRWCSRRARVAGDEWLDVEHVGWAPAGRGGAASLRRPGRPAPAAARPRPGAVRRGPARARRVRERRPDRLRRAAAERRGRAGALARGRRRAADVAAGGRRP